MEATNAETRRCSVCFTRDVDGMRTGDGRWVCVYCLHIEMGYDGDGRGGERRISQNVARMLHALERRLKESR